MNPCAIRDLFPDLMDDEFPFRAVVQAERVYFLTSGHTIRIPTPPTMANRGNFVASISELVRWLGQRAEALGVNVFTGFPVGALMVKDNRVVGVRTVPAGLRRDGSHADAYSPAADVAARITVLSEGTRGMLSEAYCTWQQIPSENPQTFALGVKELWETKRPLNAVVHTFGWPLPADTFGGGFIYPLAPDLVAIGLVAGMDYPDASLDVHELLQKFKQHRLVRRLLEEGSMVEWGAKTIPEGGFYSLRRRRSGDGLIIVGDAAGYVDVASLKGIHYAMQSGIYAARAIFEALRSNDTSATSLGSYDRAVDCSYITCDLRKRRNIRLAFQNSNVYIGGMKAALMTLTAGVFPGGRLHSRPDADVPRAEPSALEPRFSADGVLTFDKLAANYRSGNTTRDDIPSHLIVGHDVTPEAAALYEHMCPAGVYERIDGRLKVNPSNCVDCNDRRDRAALDATRGRQRAALSPHVDRRDQIRMVGEAYRKNQRIMPKSTCSLFNVLCGIMEAPLGGPVAARLIFFADGSDDGTAAAKLVARILDPAAVCCVAVVVVTWPERYSTLWGKPHEVQFEVDDLHATAFAATEAARQLHLALATHAEKIDELITTGDPTQATLKAIDDVKADLAFLSVTSGLHRARITHWVQEVTRRAPCPVVVIHGSALGNEVLRLDLS